MSEEENDNCSENSQSKEYACSSCPQESKQEDSKNRRSLRLKTVYSVKGYNNMSKEENDNCSENSQSNEFACSSCPQESKQEDSKNRRSLRLKTVNTIHYGYTLKRRNRPRSSNVKVLMLWDDGIINVVRSFDLFRSDHCARVNSEKANIEVGEKVKMFYNKCCYHGSILSINEEEFLQVASKYPSKHFLLRDLSMVAYTKPTVTGKVTTGDGEDRVLSEDEDLQMMFGEDASHTDLDKLDLSYSRTCDQKINSQELCEGGEEEGIITECIKAQSINIEDFNAMSEEVVVLSEREPQISPSKLRSPSQDSSNELSEKQKEGIFPNCLSRDTIKPCSVVIETNIANEMNMTDVYLVDQRIKVSHPPPLVKSPSPLKLQNQSQSCSIEYKVTPDISKHLSSCKEVELIMPTNFRNKSQLPTKQASSLQKKDKNKSKLTKHCSQSLKGFRKAKGQSDMKNVIKDKFSKLVASKHNLNGVEVIPIEALEEVTTEQSDGQSLNQSNIYTASAASSSEMAEQICAVESSIEKVSTSESSSFVNENEMCVSNQTSKITNTFNCDTTTFTVTQRLMKNTLTSTVIDNQTSLPKVITLPVLSCENYFSTTGFVENNYFSSIPFSSSKITSPNFYNATRAIENVGCEKSSSPMKNEQVIHAAGDLKLSSKTLPKPKSLSLDPCPTNTYRRLISKDYKERKTSAAASNISNTDNNRFSDDSDCILVTSSVKNYDILVEPSLEECIDGVPPFIQDVFLCENIRDGFNNSDLVFVLSLLPDMEEMTDTQKFHFQMKVIETLNDVLDDPKLQIKGLR